MPVNKIAVYEITQNRDCSWNDSDKMPLNKMTTTKCLPKMHVKYYICLSYSWNDGDKMPINKMTAYVITGETVDKMAVTKCPTTKWQHM